MSLPFGNLQIGAMFELNGTNWVKQSKRTAYREGAQWSWFYFGLTERVKLRG